MNSLLRHKRLTARTDLQDNHLYIFNRAFLEVLLAKPSLANIKQVLPLSTCSAMSRLAIEVPESMHGALMSHIGTLLLAHAWPSLVKGV